jgi:hypothetical protein
MGTELQNKVTSVKRDPSFLKEATFRVGKAEYHKVDYGVFRVSFDELHEARLGDLPVNSTVEITGLPAIPGNLEAFISARRYKDEGDFPNLEIVTQVHVIAGPEFDLRIDRVQRAFAPLIHSGILPYPLVFPPKSINIKQGRDNWSKLYSLNYGNRPEICIREAIAPFVETLRSLCSPEAKLFICHASEDKPTARRFSEFLRNHGVGVWFDELEILVGDSIVQKVNDGLAGATHLALLLSPSSICKPWVQREMSSALMRQLADRSILLVPILVAPCDIPPILADLKYADCHVDEVSGFKSVLQTIRQTRITGTNAK